MYSTKILIVEDEIIIADYIGELLEKEGFTQIEIANDIEEAKKHIASFNPELILLDINIHGENEGINLSTELELKSKVIFLTAQNDRTTIHAAIKTKPQAYLTKPIKKNDLMAAISLAIVNMQDTFLVFKDGYTDVKLSYDELLYIKSDGNYIDVFTTNGKHTLRRSLESFHAELDKKLFQQIHRSIIVNTSKITEKKSNALFINEIELPISRSFRISL
ncbi:MAG: response regulator transcription factor [Crocinitomicaceae bacterium]|nr:MAG: response regulator transcription factor [Crocinitomicaceae bacterium]